jgi:hypothetical protein
LHSLLICSGLLELSSLGAGELRADMNPPKPITSKAYVPKTPKIIPLQSSPNSHKQLHRKIAFGRQQKGGKKSRITARNAWQQRLSNQFSQASRAGAGATLLTHD